VEVIPLSPVLQLLFQLSVLIAVAKLAGYISTRLHQPAVLGEILAGLLLGPSLLNIQALPFLTNTHLPETINELAELGVIFLMFLAGLEADLGQMRKAGKVVILAGLLGVVVPLGMGLGLALPFGFDLVQSFAIGMLLTATSVSISAQTLLELGVLRSRVGIALLGAAVVDDVVVILLLSVFLAIATGGGAGIGSIVLLLLRVVLFVVLFGGIGWVVVPRLLRRVDHLPISQGLVAAAVVLAMVFAWSAEVVGNVAMITGSFLAGILAGRSSVHRRIEEGVSVLTYGFFVPIFFVNIGLHANIWALRGDLILITVLLSLVAIISKVLGSGAGALAGGFTRGEALRLGIGMISRGEVGLIVAQLLVSSGVVPGDIITVAVIMVLVTTLVTPILLRAVFPRKPSADAAEPRPVQ
jgi:Kef-type K+ transport system membrane component KefB